MNPIIALGKVRKKYNLKGNDSLSASQYREVQLLTSKKGSNYRGASSSRKKQIFNFYFDYSVSISSDLNTLTITLVGRHLSKNQYDSLPLFDRKHKSSKHHFKKAFKTAAEVCRLKQKGLFNSLKKKGIFPSTSASVHYIFYNPVSRDHDNGSENIKRLQDTFVTLGILEDDNRDVLRAEKEPLEVIIRRGEAYKMEAIIRFP